MSDREPTFGESHSEEESSPDNVWDKKDRIVVSEKMKMSELKALNPFRDDEAYIAEKQVDLLREVMKTVDLKDVLYIKAANLVFTIAAFFTTFRLIFGTIEATPISLSFAASLFLIPYAGRKLFRASRTWDSVTPRLVLATRIAAFGEAYRSRYNLILDQKSWDIMRKTGTLPAVSTEDETYSIIADMDYSSQSYAIIRHTGSL